MKFNKKLFFQYNKITEDNEENFTYLDESHSGADPGLILGCYQNFAKKNEHRNDATSRKIKIQQESSR